MKSKKGKSEFIRETFQVCVSRRTMMIPARWKIQTRVVPAMAIKARAAHGDQMAFKVQWRGRRPGGEVK